MFLFNTTLFNMILFYTLSQYIKTYFVGGLRIGMAAGFIPEGKIGIFFGMFQTDIKISEAVFPTSDHCIPDSLKYATRRSLAIADCSPAFLRSPRLTVGESVMTGEDALSVEAGLSCLSANFFRRFFARK